jgi:CheY-like chemotaxis protein
MPRCTVTSDRSHQSQRPVPGILVVSPRYCRGNGRCPQPRHTGERVDGADPWLLSGYPNEANGMSPFGLLPGDVRERFTSGHQPSGGRTIAGTSATRTCRSSPGPGSRAGHLGRRRRAGAGHAVEVAHAGAVALERLEARAFDVVISDMSMPGMEGWESILRPLAAPALLPTPFLPPAVRRVPVDGTPHLDTAPVTSVTSTHAANHQDGGVPGDTWGAVRPLMRVSPGGPPRTRRRRLGSGPRRLVSAAGG